MRIKLTKNKYAIVDPQMHSLLNKYKWYASYCDHGDRYYARRTEHSNGSAITERMHWYVIGKPLPGFVIDHINGDGLDNRRENLRVVTNSDNMINRYTHRAGKLYGTYFNKQRKKWEAKITINKKRKIIGFYNTELEAHLAYKKEKHALKYGEL